MSELQRKDRNVGSGQIMCCANNGDAVLYRRVSRHVQGKEFCKALCRTNKTLIYLTLYMYWK